jgi:hypothetical protein
VLARAKFLQPLSIAPLMTARDILSKLALIDGAIALAAFAAVFTLIDPRVHAERAITSLVVGLHWILAFVLVGEKCKPQAAIATDMEVIWFVYGLLLGGVDSDSTTALVSIMVSAAIFQRHRRVQRLEQAEPDTLASKLETPVTDNSAFA